MIQFLLVFDKQAGRLLSRQDFEDRSDAMGARFEAERLHADNPEVEVVVLGAASFAALKATHSRYFLDYQQMYERALSVSASHAQGASDLRE